MKRFFVYALMAALLVAIFVPNTVFAFAELEQNDTVLDAQPLPAGDEVSGEIVEKDTDFYSVTLAESGNLTLDITAYMKYHSLEVFDEAGKHMFVSDNNTWNSTVGYINKVHTLDLDAGTYYIKINGKRDYDYAYSEVATGKYTLKASFVGAGGTELEDNDVLESANATELGATVKGQIAINDATDFFSVVLPESGALTIDMTAYMKYHAIEVFDAMGTHLWVSDHNTWNSTVGYINKVHTLDLDAGTYFLKINGKEDFDYAYTNTATGNYTFKTSFVGAGGTELEDNDVLESANAVELEETVKGQIAINDATDFFSVTLPESGALTIDMTAYMKYHAIEVFDAMGKHLWVSDRNTWNSTIGYLNKVHTLNLDAGTYFLKINGKEDFDDAYTSTATGNYTFKTSFVGAGGTELEDNDVLESANAVELEETVKGQIAINDATDFFSVTLPESGALTIDITAYMQYHAVELFDDVGDHLWVSDGNKWNATIGYVNKVHTLDLTAGTYYIKINGKEDYDYAYTNTATGNYTFKTSFAGAGATELEDNDVLEDANAIELNGTVNGQIAINDATDFFSVTLPESGTLTLDMTAYMQYHAVELFDAVGDHLWVSDGNTWNATVGYINKVHTLDLTAGTYYIKINGKQDYDYNYSKVADGNYTLKTSFVGAGATEAEDNNELEYANAVAVNDVVRGHIAINDRVDFFQFNVSQKSDFLFTISSHMRYTSFYLYDVSGEQIAKIDNKEWNSSLHFRVDDYVMRDLEPGTYYIKVTGYRVDSRDPSTGTYVLWLNHEHVWDEGVVTKTPVGEKAGEKTFTCVQCGNQKVEEFFACADDSHEWTEATCTDAVKCTKCGMTDGMPLGHDWEEATCEAPKTCKRCDLTEGEPLEHEWEDATCETAKTCSVCEAVEGEPLGHQWTEATCQAPKTCSLCDKTEGKPLDHKFEDDKCIYCGGSKGDLAFLYGDADMNGVVNYLDAMAVLQAAVGLGKLPPDVQRACDVDGDGVITYLDAMLVLQAAVGLIDAFPVEPM